MANRPSLASRVNSHQMIFRGDYGPSNVFFARVRSSRKIDRKIEILCQNSWKNKINEAKRAGQKLWDSQVCRFEGKQGTGNRLKLLMSTIPYSTRLAMNEQTPTIKKLGLEYAPLGMYTSCFVRTQDSKFIFIRRSNKFPTQRKVSLLGGILTEDDRPIKTGGDLFSSVAKEIKEEIGVDTKKLKKLCLKAGYITENFNFCFLFEAVLTLSFDNVQKLFRRGKTDGEACELLGFNKNSLEQYLALAPERDRTKFKIIGLIRK